MENNLSREKNDKLRLTYLKGLIKVHKTLSSSNLLEETVSVTSRSIVLCSSETWVKANLNVKASESKSDLYLKYE